MGIQQRRMKRGWSQEHLAEVAGLSPRTVQRIEAGKRAGFETLLALAAVFGTDVAILMKENRMQNQTDTTAAEAARDEMADEYINNIKAFRMNVYTFLIIMPVLYWLNVTTSSYVWWYYVAAFWGLSFVLHYMAVRVMFGTFDLGLDRTNILAHLKQ